MNLKKTALIPALVLALTGLGACGSDDGDTSGEDKSESAEQSAGADEQSGATGDADEGYSTEVTKCGLDSTGIMINATTEITNETDSTQSYIVHLDISDGSGQKFTQVHATSGDVAAGETVAVDGLAQTSGGLEDGEINCDVSDVTVD